LPFPLVETAMQIARRAGVVLGSVSAAVASMAAGLPARAAEAPPWQIAATVHYGPADYASGYTAVVAPAKNDGWAFGGTNPGGTSRPTAERWNGQRWQPWALPSGLSGFIVAAGASSPSNVWAVGDGYALRWDGTRWRVAKTWSQGGQTTSVAVISATNVWVFGSSSFSGVTGLGAWHFTGRTWVRATGIAARIYRVSAIAPHNIWAVTVSPHGGSVVHYDGQSWARVPAADAALANTQLDDVLAAFPGNVWVSGVSPANGTDGHLVLAHWNGRRWQRFVSPWPVQQPERFATDGALGVWIPAVTGGENPETWILHLSAEGVWTRTPIAFHRPDTGVGVGDLALIPGTTTLWGSGGLLTTTGGNAAIWEHDVPGISLAARNHRAERGHVAGHSRLTIAGRGGVVRVSLTVAGRGVLRVYLTVRECHAGRRALAPTWLPRAPAHRPALSPAPRPGVTE
jgi:hypothetical protein